MRAKSSRSVAITVTLSATALLTSHVALAAATISTDNTTIGTMTTPKNYGSGYSGFWRIGAPDYSLLTDGTNSFLNAPNANGTIFFRQANTDDMTYGPGGKLTVPGPIKATATNFNHAVTGIAAGGIGVTGSSTISIGVKGASGSYIGVFGTSNAGFGLSGIYGETTNVNGIGIVGHNYTSGANCFSNPNTCPSAIYGDSNFNQFDVWAGNFNGDLNVIGDYYLRGQEVNLSDGRLKKDVKDASYGLDQVLKLRPVTYKWKKLPDGSEGTRTNIGLIAQEVQKIVPELVLSRGKSDVLGINYTGLIPVLIKAVQQQEKFMRQQEGRIAAQDTRLAAQEARLAALERGHRSVASSAPAFGTVAALGVLPLGLLGFAVGRRRKDKGID